MNNEFDILFPQIKMREFKALPFPRLEELNVYYQKKLESLVTRILTAKRADPSADTSAWEAEIDVLVYRLYGLSYEEVLLVDPDFGWSAEAYANQKNKTL